jgi:SAM-dependent methyltransferase
MRRHLFGSKQTLFRVFYRLGFTPWDNHPLAQSLRNLVEGNDSTGSLPAGAALDVGCGTGDSSIYLSQHGWHVTGVDFTAEALGKARAKARAANAEVNFVRADVRHLRQAGINGPLQLIVDNGCLHNMNDDDRDAYVREVSAVAAPEARLLVVAFNPGGRFGVRGINHSEMERRFASGWTLVSAGAEQNLDGDKTPTRYYLFRRDA